MGKKTDKNNSNGNATNELGATTPTPRNIHLKSARDVRRFLSRIMNELYRKELDPEIASKLGYLANITLAAIKQDEGGDEATGNITVTVK